VLSKVLETKHVHSPGWDQNRVVGAAAKEILWSLLDSCDYSVYPFGYESTFSTLKRGLRENERLRDNDIAQRIRSMPDFLVTHKDEVPQLVEVKFRKGVIDPNKFKLSNWEVGRYQKFWSDTVLVVLSPFGDRFFAQFVKNLNLEGNSYANTWFDYTDFSSISSVFPRTTGRLESFHIGIDKLAGLWKKENEN
jgi:hypothetical protein